MLPSGDLARRQCRLLWSLVPNLDVAVESIRVSYDAIISSYEAMMEAFPMKKYHDLIFARFFPECHRTLKSGHEGTLENRPLG